MGDVVDFRTKEEKEEEDSILIDVGGAIALCGCVEEGTPVNLVVSMDVVPKIVGAVCLTCKTRYDISSGILTPFDRD